MDEIWDEGGGKLVLQTGRGSRRFVFDVPEEEWPLRKKPV